MDHWEENNQGENQANHNDFIQNEEYSLLISF